MKHNDGSSTPKRRGRPPKIRKVVSNNTPMQTQPATMPEPLAVSQAQAVLADEQLAYTLEEEQLSPFSSYLRHMFHHDRIEIARVAKALDVSENTLYRWMNGNSEPRAMHLKHLLEVLPEQQRDLTSAINQTFPGALDTLSSGLREVQKDIYRRVLELLTTIVDAEQRSWQIMQVLFEHILQHLDTERHGLAVTYTKLMPPRADGIHSLVEVFMRGNSPWPFALENHAYLGSTTLAGTAAMLERMQTWDNLSETERLQVEADEFERSACACPVERGGRIAGVLIISSRQPDFFINPVASQAALEYTQLLSLAFSEEEFTPFSQLNLVPMPELKWQHAEVGHSYINRIILCARKFGISRQDAEQLVRIDMETEFEALGRLRYAQLHSEEDIPAPHLPSLS